MSGNWFASLAPPRVKNSTIRSRPTVIIINRYNKTNVRGARRPPSTVFVSVLSAVKHQKYGSWQRTRRRHEPISTAVGRTDGAAFHVAQGAQTPLRHRAVRGRLPPSQARGAHHGGIGI